MVYRKRISARFLLLLGSASEAGDGYEVHTSDGISRGCSFPPGPDARGTTVGRGCLLALCQSSSPGAQLERNGSLQDQLHS
jgi:hypothetical protein